MSNCILRQTVIASFNKRVDDFNGDLRAFNDYLEEVEEISKLGNNQTSDIFRYLIFIFIL